MAAVKRLVPKPETLRALYLVSGNVCAFPGCSTVMIDRNGTMIGEVCHIEAAEENGPRFNKNMTNEKRRQQSNLYLLCPTHHTLVDKDIKNYTVAKLKAMKAKHEGTFREIDETLRQGFEQQFSDQTDAIAPLYPSTFASLMASSGSELTKKESDRSVTEFKAYIDRLRNVPDAERQFLLSILRRAKKLGNTRDRMHVHADDVKSSLKVGHHKLERLAASLERHSLGDLREYQQNEWVVEIYDPAEYISWLELLDFAEKKNIPLERFVIDVQFHDLD